MSAYDTAEIETVESTTELTTDEIAIADTGSGVLVFDVTTEYRASIDREVEVARELVAFADVDDWSVIAEALRTRGFGVGATTQLPELPIDELPEADE